MTGRSPRLCILLATLGIVGGGCGSRDSPTEPTPVCSIAISPASATFASQGGTGTVSVIAPAGCGWSVPAVPSWITVTAGGSGSGNGTVAYSVASNTATESRSATLTIGGQSHAIAQDGGVPAICNYALAPASAEFTKDAASGSFAVSVQGECAWTAVSSAPWLAVSSGGQGSGNGTVTYAVARNADTADRTGTITVAGRAFTVRQFGDYPACEYSVLPVDTRPCMPAGTLSATVTTQAHCSWTVSSNSAWLGVGSGGGTGPGVITITFPDNYGAPRAGIVMVRWPTPTAGQNIHVAQAGCLYAVSRSEIAVVSGGGSGSFDVIQQSEPLTCGGATQDRCVWTAQSDAAWITITSGMPRSGDNPVAFTVAANDSVSPRVGRITVRDKAVVITQVGR